MQTRTELLPSLKYLWIGPPRIDSSGENKLGSDVREVIDAAQKCSNPIEFFCLDEHVNYYNELFKTNEVNIKVNSIENYLESKKGDDRVNQYVSQMLQMKNELLSPPRNRVIDRVSFKDAFSLFLLACEGGYTLDTSVKLQEDVTNFAFPAYDFFKSPHYGPSAECWLMYAPENDLELPLVMLDSYLSRWDREQDLIRGHENQIKNIIRYHANITGLIISSLEAGLSNMKDPFDPAWKMDMEESNQEGVAAIATIPSLPIVKHYGNTHKPEYECRTIVINNLQNVLRQPEEILSKSRITILHVLENAGNRLQHLTDPKEILALSERINNTLEALSSLDIYAKKLQSDKKAGTINDILDGTYAVLLDVLVTSKNPKDLPMNHIKAQLDLYKLIFEKGKAQGNFLSFFDNYIGTPPKLMIAVAEKVIGMLNSSNINLENFNRDEHPVLQDSAFEKIFKDNNLAHHFTAKGPEFF